MASQRFRIDIDTISGGVPAESTVAYSQTAGATAGFVDLFLDNSDIKSEAQLEQIVEVFRLSLRRLYRVSVGGVSS